MILLFNWRSERWNCWIFVVMFWNFDTKIKRRKPLNHSCFLVAYINNNTRNKPEMVHSLRPTDRSLQPPPKVHLLEWLDLTTLHCPLTHSANAIFIWPTPGDISNEKDVLNWMVAQKTDSSIDDIDRATLFEYIESKDFLAVMFCKAKERNGNSTLKAN